MDEASLELSRGDIGFSAAHFSIHQGRSERLHGHNYLVRLWVRGEVGEEGTVLDFSVLKAALRELCAGLDEHMLVPTRSPRVRVEETDAEVVLTEGSRRFLIPRDDVVLLPVVNTTCECLAAHLLLAVRERLGATDQRLRLLVEETPGQGASVSE
ncbi:MAG TPA: 6-carboxytetrahydropterin synthase [Candidatus Dormibacteraeota bacterium]|nr:6-carboxytetrahydropterin synthase [Candidatus Dormibacteraeota bacterium]